MSAMDKKHVKSAISYVLKAAYFAAILSLVVFFFWKSPAAFAISAASFFCALIIEALLFAFGFGLFSETKPVLVAAVAAFAFIGILSVVLSSHSPLHFISSCSMLPAYSQGDAVLALNEPPNAPMVKIGSAYQDGKAEVHGPNGTFFVDGSLYSYCSRNGSELCNQFIKSPSSFYEIRGPVLFQYGLCARSDGTSGPCTVSAIVGSATMLASQGGDVVVFPGEYAGGNGFGIVHRLMFAINDSKGDVYYFTKGDNNPVYDAQAGGRALPAGSAVGRVALRLPFLGSLSKNYNNSLANAGCGSHYVG